MPIAWYALVGLFSATLINRAADCWLSPEPLACGLTRRPRRQAAVLVITPALFAWLAWQNGGQTHPWALCLAGAALILLAVIDVEQRRVPNIVVIPAVALALLAARVEGSLASSLAGAAAALVSFLALCGLGRRLYGTHALGPGDVKLAAYIGALFGLTWMPYALLLGILMAGAVAAVLLAAGRVQRGDWLPYGALLALAGLIVLVASTRLVAG
jgi:leader peptidase (prepilin peptidase)/N-methyltransferase